MPPCAKCKLKRFFTRIKKTVAFFICGIYNSNVLRTRAFRTLGAPCFLLKTFAQGGFNYEQTDKRGYFKRRG